MSNTVNVICQCGTLLKVKEKGAPDDDRTPCPDCHEIGQSIEVEITDNA